MKFKVNLIILLIIISINETIAQKQVTKQDLYWFRYSNNFRLSKKINIQSEIENRVFFEGNTQHHLIMHSRLHYIFNSNWGIAAGFTYSLQNPQTPHPVNNLTVPEYRPNQELNYTKNITSKFTIINRLRLDERFISKNNGIILQDGYDFNFRIRYRMLLTYLLFTGIKNNTTSAKLSNEIMFNAGKQIVYNQFDQNRVYIGIEQSFSKHISAEIGYLNWYQQRTVQNQFFDRRIIRLTLYHKI